MIPMNSQSSVLIDENGHARLTGYGLTPIVPGNQFVDSLQDGRPTPVPTWAAPEISEGRPVTKAGDIFTFAMVVVEVRTRGFRENFLNLFAANRRLQNISCLSNVTMPCQLGDILNGQRR